MRHGLHLEALRTSAKHPLDLTRFSQPQDFEAEIRRFRKEKKSDAFPIENQDAMVRNVLKGLTGRRPNVVMVGEPGVGKSTTLDFIVKVLTGEVQLEGIKRHLPEDVGPLLQQVAKKLATYEHRHYLFVPNLAHPLNVTPLSYTDAGELKRDADIAQDFGEQVARYLLDYPTTNRGHL